MSRTNRRTYWVASSADTPIGTSPVTAAISASKSMPRSSLGRRIGSFQAMKPWEIP
ncbi:hypothetical protein D3C87_2211770 [compost metagenome]